MTSPQRSESELKYSAVVVGGKKSENLTQDIGVPSVNNEDCLPSQDRTRTILARNFNSASIEQNIDNTRRSLFLETNDEQSVKLPSTPERECSKQTRQITDKLPERKRRKSEGEQVTETSRIGSMLNRANDEEDLIGDFSKPYCLPRTTSKHQDLKSISPQTVGCTIVFRIIYLLCWSGLQPFCRHSNHTLPFACSYCKWL
jgi:hypothetical protein